MRDQSSVHPVRIGLLGRDIRFLQLLWQLAPARDESPDSVQKQEIPALTHRATHAAWWSSLEIAVRYGVQFLVVVVLARLLEPADFGMMAMLMVFTSFAALLAEGGLSSALVQKQNATSDDEVSVFLINLCASCALVVVLWLIAPSIARFYGQPRLGPLLYVLSWVLPLGALMAVPNAVLIRRLDFRTRATAELLASLCSAALALGLAWRGYGVWSLIWQAVAGAGLRALLLWLLSGWRPRGQFDARAFGSLLRFGSPLLVANVLNLISVRMQSLLIGRLFDARALGFYALAQDTQQAPAQFITGVLNRVGLPVFSAAATRPEKLAGALRLSLRLSLFVFAPCMAGIAAVATPLVLTLYGEAWAPAAPILSLLALAAVFWPSHVLNLAAISAIGRTSLVLKLEIVKALVSIPMVVVAAFYGATAVAWAVLLSNLACLVINTWYSHKLIGYGAWAQGKDFLPILLLTLPSTVLAWLVSRLANSAVSSLLFGIVAGAIIYLSGAILFRMQAWKDLVGFLDALRGRQIVAEQEGA